MIAVIGPMVVTATESGGAWIEFEPWVARSSARVLRSGFRPLVSSSSSPPSPAPASASASASNFRPAKRPRNLTEEEAAAITRNFTRGDFFVGTSAPVRIDPRLPVRLTLAEGDQVHFTIGETIV
ncbi:hypothetical protein EVJ58_g7361 [Rhodofomes roseus]|uniref:Uncharacterized protein n=1 Tax=Rhodofomes roseus TaxID=34475 RepID=A0A4Y9Y449_9APHY|nr:hypothetical protein EVJ58_g7361 [Rhodofomes roseus]